MTIVLRVLFALAVVVMAASCRSESAPRRAPLPPATDALDVATRGRPARYAFRSRGGDAVAGTPSHRATVTADGAIRFEPRVRARGVWNAAPPLRLATWSIARGARLDGAARVAVEPDGSTRIQRGPVVERLVDAPAGLEQAWELAAEPPGEGDLAIRVHAEGYAVRASGTGVALVDERTKTTVRYADARWIDARGESVDVALAVDGQDIVLTVPADRVASAAYPVILDPTISAEQVLDAPVVADRAEPESFIRVAPGKNGTFLVVWMDKRVKRPMYNYFGDTQIYGLRVAADGTLIDTTPFVIAQTFEQEQDSPQVAFDGVGTWLVVWGQYSFTENDCEQFVGTRVTDTGTTVDPQGIAFGCAYSEFGAAFDGTTFQVIAAGSDLSRWTVPPTGAVPPPQPVKLVPGIQRGEAAIACDGKTKCMLAWTTVTGMHTSLLGPQGLVDPTGAFVGYGGQPAITYDGTNFVVNAFTGGIQGARVSPAGVVLDATPVQLTPTAPSRYLDHVPAASDGTATMAIWTDAQRQIHGARLSKAGALLDASPLTFTTQAAAENYAIAASGGQYLVAWFDSATGRVRAGRVTSAGVPLDGDGVSLSAGVNREDRVVLARSQNGFLALWRDFRGGSASPAFYYTRLDANGAPLDSPARLLGPATVDLAVAASDGTDYAVAWTTGGATSIAKIAGATGAIVGSPASIAGASGPLALLHDGTQYVLGYTTVAGTMATRLDASGAPVAPALVVATGSLDTIAAAHDPQGYLFVLGMGGTYGRRVSAAWSVVGADVFPISLPATGVDDQHGVAFDGQNHVAVWRRALHDDPPRGDVYAARISPAGTVLDASAIGVETSAIAALFPAVVAMNDGVGPLVLWSDDRRTDRMMDFDVFGTVLRSRDGALLDPGGIPIANGAGNELEVAAVPAGPARALVAYQRMDGSAAFGTERIRARFVTTGKLASAACASSAECASRSCADGFCCDSPCNGACQTCAATPGTCTPVVSADDPDSCGADRTCTAASTCISKRGGPCVRTSDCLEGTCSQGVCCDRPCDGACESCGGGTCAPRAARSPGAPTCAPYACDGVSATCPTACTTNDACPSTARCDLASHTCVEGPICIDARTLGAPNQPDVGCFPYVCELSACRTTCRNVTDCVYPAVCTEAGTCVVPGPVAAGGGCSSTGQRTSPPWALLGVVLLALRRRSATAARPGPGRRSSPSP